MNHSTGPHEPTPEFRAHLEWEVVRSLRGDRRRMAPLPSSGWRRLRAAAAIVLALGIGASTSMVWAQVQDSRIRDMLLASERLEQETLQMRVDLARKRVEQLRGKADAGVVSRQVLAAAEAELHSLEAKLARSRLNMEEIQATTLPPRDELTAPLVGERDFVKERLDLEVDAAEQRLSAAERALAEAEQRHAAGAATRLAVLEPKAEVVRARVNLDMLLGKLELRRLFLRKEIDQEELRKRELQHRHVRYLELEERLYQIDLQRLALLREMVETGAADKEDVLRVELEVAEREKRVKGMRESLQNVLKHFR